MILSVEPDRYVTVGIHEMVVLKIVLEEIRHFKRFLVSQVELQSTPAVPTESNGTRPFLYRSNDSVCLSILLQPGTPVIEKAEEDLRRFHFLAFQCAMCFRVAKQTSEPILLRSPRLISIPVFQSVCSTDPTIRPLRSLLFRTVATS